MAYTTGDTILDDHYNGFATSVNAIWGSGSGDAGYGETSTVAAVSAGATITATQWTTLLSRITSMANHQGSSITAITNPSAGNTISAYTALSTNIATITTNRLNVAARQAIVNGTASTTTNLTGTITQTGKFVFGSENQARYFFNQGGRFTITWSFTGFTANLKANNWSTLIGQCGSYIINAQSSGKSGGSGTATTNLSNLGYHDLTGSYVIAFKQFFDSGGYAAYTSNYLQLELYKSGGEVFWKTSWVDAAADSSSFNKSIYNTLDNVDGTKTTTYGHERPSTTYASATYGTITLTTTANG